jgi:hypothetical protein
MTRDAAFMALIGCPFGLAYIALRKWTTWCQYSDYGIHQLCAADRRVWTRWTVVWMTEGGCWTCAAWVITRFIDPR